MRKAFAYAVLLCLTGIVGCTKPSAPVAVTEATPALVPVDLATPDKALKSYWTVRDAVRTRHAKLFAQSIDQYRAAEVQLSAVADGTLAKTFSSEIETPETYLRDIIDVKVESESRAVIVVVVKNVTPIPAGAEVSKFDEERRRDGERFKYVLEKVRADWRVSEIWEWRTYPPLEWVKRLPGDGKPSVASLTFLGI